MDKNRLCGIYECQTVTLSMTCPQINGILKGCRAKV